MTEDELKQQAEYEAKVVEWEAHAQKMRDLGYHLHKVEPIDAAVTSEEGKQAEG